MSAITYNTLALALPTSVQSNGWLPHAAAALLLAGADLAPVSLAALTQHMSDMAGCEVSRVSATRGAWVMDKQDMLAVSKKGTYLLNEQGRAYALTLLNRNNGATVAPVVSLAPVVSEDEDTNDEDTAPSAAPVVVEAPAPAPVVVEAPAPAPVKPVGVAWLPPVVDAPVDAYYDGDEYLLALAVEQTPCFGTYSTRAEACASCPIAGACSNMLVTRMATVAATLAKRDEEARKVEEARLAAFRKEEERKAEERKAVESILGTPPAPAPAPSAPTVSFPAFTAPAAPAPSAPVAAPAAPVSAEPVKYTEITAAFPGVCSGCKGKIGKGDTVRYVSGKGMYHPACVA